MNEDEQERLARKVEDAHRRKAWREEAAAVAAVEAGWKAMGLSSRSAGFLMRQGLYTPRDVRALTDAELAARRLCGVATLRELRSYCPHRAPSAAAAAPAAAPAAYPVRGQDWGSATG